MIKKLLEKILSWFQPWDPAEEYEHEQLLNELVTGDANHVMDEAERAAMDLAFWRSVKIIDEGELE